MSKAKNGTTVRKIARKPCAILHPLARWRALEPRPERWRAITVRVLLHVLLVASGLFVALKIV